MNPHGIPHQFIVITDVGEPGDRGNLAIPDTDVYLDPQMLDRTVDFDAPFPTIGQAFDAPHSVLFLRVPVFTLGEILVCNHDGRELAGRGRKPSKWSVKYETFDNIDAALECAKNTLA